MDPIDRNLSRIRSSLLSRKSPSLAEAPKPTSSTAGRTTLLDRDIGGPLPVDAKKHGAETPLDCMGSTDDLKATKGPTEVSPLRPRDDETVTKLPPPASAGLHDDVVIDSNWVLREFANLRMRLRALFGGN